MTKRPNMSDYFRSQIDFHVNGMMAGPAARVPNGVRYVHGDVTDPRIVVVMADGTEFLWTCGGYSTRKVNGCYAPRMPKPVA